MAKKTQNKVKKQYKVEGNYYEQFKLFLQQNKGLFAIAAVLLFGIVVFVAITKQAQIEAFWGFDRYFTKDDPNFKIIIVPFGLTCTDDKRGDSQKYDVGEVIARRLEEKTAEDSLPLSLKYIDHIRPKYVSKTFADSVLKHHDADMVVYGRQENCNANGKVCINYLTHAKEGLGKAGNQIRNDMQEADYQQIEEGHLQENLDLTVLFLATISQVKNLSPEEYSAKLQNLLDDPYKFAYQTQISLFLYLAESLWEEKKQDKALAYYEQAYNRSSHDHDAQTRIGNRLVRLCMEIGQLEKGWDYAQKNHEKLRKRVAEFRKAQEKPAQNEYEKTQKITYKPYYEQREWELILAYDYVGQIAEKIGKLEEAQRYFEEVLALSEKRVQANPLSNERKREIAITYERLGDIYESKGDLEKALFFFEKYNTIIDELHRQNSDSEDYQQVLAITYEKLGNIYQSKGDLEKALHFFQKEIEFFEKLVDENKKSEDNQRGLAYSYSKIGNIYRSKGDLEKALYFFEKYNSIMEKLVDGNPKSEGNQRGLAISYEKVGNIYQAKGDLEKALGFFEKYNSIMKKLANENPKSEQNQRSLAISFERLGAYYLEKKNDTEARKYFEKYAQLGTTLYQKNAINTEIQDTYAESQVMLRGIEKLQDSGVGLDFSESRAVWTRLFEKTKMPYYEKKLKILQSIEQNPARLREKMIEMVFLPL